MLKRFIKSLFGSWSEHQHSGCLVLTFDDVTKDKMKSMVTESKLWLFDRKS